MRNLKLQFCDQVDSNISGVKFLLTDSTGCGEKQNAKLFLVTGDKVFATNERFENFKEIANETNIIGADYLAINDEICLATKDGRILSVDPQNGSINENSYCDVGLVQMAWSPEQEVVVFITKTNNVVVMTCTYDPIAEHALQEHCEKEQQFVNVGWGKKETQFHGSEGKNAAKQKQTFEKPKEIDDILSGIEVSWRQDGAFFAVSFVSEQYGRMFKVFDKEGILQYTSEKVNGLQSTIAWRPSGTWIAVPHLLPNKSTIALFEKNGLRHREIVLPFNFENEKICNLRWSNESDILVVHTELSTPASDGGNAQDVKTQQLYLYTIGNYHWYLKQTLSFAANEQIAAFQFGMDSALERTLHVILDSGVYLRYRWYFDVDKYDSAGLVAVIDGNKLLLTNLSKAIVPPPMSAMQLQIDDNINACAFLKIKQNDLFLSVYDAKGNFHLYKTNLSSQTTTFELLAKLKPDESVAAVTHQRKQFANLMFFKLNLNEHGSSHRQRITQSDDQTKSCELIATQCTNHTTTFLLIDLNIEDAKYSTTLSLQLTGIVNAVDLCKQSGQLFAHTINDNTIWPIECKTNNFTINREQRRRLPHAATQIITHTKSTNENLEYSNSSTTTNILTLCENQSLYFDDHLISDYVTSCAMVSGVGGRDNDVQYFAFTKHAELFLLRLSNRSVDAVRSIESGGKLVAICADSSRVVLQMPRGNLEAFYPRLLLLDHVGYMLDCREYDKVMDLLVKQRINLNIICDHDIVAFVRNIDEFIKSIGNVQWLNLFLSELRNEDITKTMYANSYNTKSRNYPPDFQIEHKIKYICESMLASMEKKYENDKDTRLILPIITAKVKMANLDDALELIWNLKKQETKTTESISNDVAAAAAKTDSENALKYLLYLVDVNDLYNVALGKYDFGLVLFVAQKSQKDPREFLPFLNQLKELDVDYRHFKMDEHLKRYEKALKHITKCLNNEERFEEALAFVKRHRLYNEALKCSGNQEKFYKTICLAYADFLRAEGKLDNASLMYERGGDTAQAIRCAKNCLDWQRVLSLAHAEEDAEKSAAAIALSMVPALQEKRLNAEAFYLLKTYGSSFEDALNALLKGNLYPTAIYESRLYQAQNKSQQDLIGTKIKPNLEAYVETFNGLLMEQEQAFVDYKQRLFDVREKRERLKNAAGDNAGFGADEVFDECDLLSDTTSMRSSHYTGSSRGTGKTFRSSKNRRKHERKHFSLKPGNPFEDIALIDALYGLTLKIVEQQQHVNNTCKALLELQLDEKAAQIQKRFKQMLILLQNSLNEIWIAELAVGIQQTPTADAGAAPVDYTLFQNEQRYALLDPVKRFKPQIKLSDWEHAVLI